MYDVNIQKHKDYYKAYYFKTKNMYNQTLFLEISPDRISQKILCILLLLQLILNVNKDINI